MMHPGGPGAVRKLALNLAKGNQMLIVPRENFHVDPKGHVLRPAGVHRRPE